MQKSSKKEMVRDMFDDISPKYDFLNHFLSFGIDRLWRKTLVKMLKKQQPRTILDVATGTGDLAMTIAGLNPEMIVGIDISGQMIEVGRKKLMQAGLDKLITLQQGDAEQIPFPDNHFDAITVAFGVRNFEDLDLGIREMKRVLRPGGSMYILEFSHPGSFPMKQMYGFYSRYIIPAFGKLISGNSHAYQYLPDSVALFPSGQNFLNVLEKQGLKKTFCRPLTMGIATIYHGQK